MLCTTSTSSTSSSCLRNLWSWHVNDLLQNCPILHALHDGQLRRFPPSLGHGFPCSLHCTSSTSVSSIILSESSSASFSSIVTCSATMFVGRPVFWNLLVRAALRPLGGCCGPPTASPFTGPQITVGVLARTHWSALRCPGKMASGAERQPLWLCGVGGSGHVLWTSCIHAFFSRKALDILKLN